MSVLHNVLVVKFESWFLSPLISMIKMCIFVDLTLPDKMKPRSMYGFVDAREEA